MMLRSTLPICLIGIGLMALGTALPAAAQTEPAAQPSSQDLIQALTPGAPQPKFRGLRLSTSQPGGAPAAAENPAVALDIQFQVGKAELTPQAKEVVQRLANALNSDQLAQFHFRVEGHTDGAGSDDYNMKLSERRAAAVKTALVSTYKVAPERLESVGLGKTKPLDPNDPMNPLNRRVQIINTGG
jgi:outer membrane protein OmpA-like peptidoglycan-associated protein